MPSLSLEQRVGRALKRHRLQANLTLADLSSAANLSSAMVSRIENGLVSTSLDALERLAAAMGHGLSDFFRETEAERARAQLIKRTDQRKIVRAGTKYGCTYRLLTHDKGLRRHFEALFVEMDRKSKTYPRFSHQGAEFIYMLQGRMEYRFGDKSYLVEPGDAFTFSGEVAHGPQKLLDDKIRFLCIVGNAGDRA